MDEEKLCKKYIDDLIKKHRLFDQSILTKILVKHGYELGINCLNDLSKYYDYLEDGINYDAELMQRLKTEYGYTDEYNKKMIKEWDDLEGFLISKDMI